MAKIAATALSLPQTAFPAPPGRSMRSNHNTHQLVFPPPGSAGMAIEQHGG